VPLLRQLAAGLQEGDNGFHIITFKPDPAPYSSSFIHGESWLAFNQIQTWKDVPLIYPMVTNDYSLKPVKPVVMAEGAYEEGTEYGFDVTPLWIRRQAYYSYLAGGHHSYGHNDSWRVLPTWRDALDAPGASQMSVLKRIFLGRKEWWNLVPDQAVSASGGQTKGDVLNLAARHRNGEWIMVYSASKTSFSINMNKIEGDEVNAFWVDPKTGDATFIDSFPNRGVKSFSTPYEWEDAILILETPD
ncbi:MAG: glycoside hydrolase family 140 protein, partial [Candidatus Bathyarchaeota archaeon]|nr:glycoside hydrolase family 140 protein [Candidatus Bathyarchaeota archaeon]